jgi:hypothetical protein
MAFPHPSVLCIWMYGNKDDDDECINESLGFIKCSETIEWLHI